MASSIIYAHTLAHSHTPPRTCRTPVQSAICRIPKRDSFKRYRSPTGQTPVQSKKRVRKILSAKKRLDFSGSGPLVWSEAENAALVEFICFHSPKQWPHQWIHDRSHTFWTACATFVAERTGSSNRSPFSCHARVYLKLSSIFSTPEDAELYYKEQLQCNNVVSADSALIDVATQTDHELCFSTVLENMIARELPESESFEVIDKLIQAIVSRQELNISVPDDFVSLSLAAMHTLSQCGRYNVIYGISKGIGTLRPDGSDSLIPTKRMPMGLLEYLTNFYVSSHISQVGKCPTDYLQWCETMYNTFGTKWSKLHTGPLWNVDSVAQENIKESDTCKEPIKARVNIPAPSVRTIQRRIASSHYQTDASIQLTTLDEACRSHPDAWWWLKGDGCDLNSGLCESVDHQWSGDVDIGDGTLKKLYDEYINRRKFIEEACQSRSKQAIINHCRTLEEWFSTESTFIRESLGAANLEYGKKASSDHSATKVLHRLAWNVDDLSRLSDECSKVIVELQCIKDLADEETQSSTILQQLNKLRERLLSLLQGIYRFRRSPATHIFVIMISPESRNRKPYAIPVQCIPYRSLTDNECRQLMDNIIVEMDKRKMKVAGCVTNGEFNSLRCRGARRPLSVLQIKADVRNVYSKKSMSSMLKMITPKRLEDGTITGQMPSPVVSKQLLTEIEDWRQDGASDKDVICRLRTRTVPPGYEYNTWINGKTETMPDQLRSILAQLEFSYRVRNYHDELHVPFRHHLYVPETHQVTHFPICEREDEGHVLKRIGHSTREGGPSCVKLERFAEALYDSSANLTYTALTGVRKQSVSDAERLFSDELRDFMKRKGYSSEERYIGVVGDWRKACDERGINELTRSKYNHLFLNYIVEELMPWYENYDYSYLEVNRDVSRIRGFTREILNALIANIESREWRRLYIVANKLPPEHPRASTTDDVECFFSTLRDSIGKDFTLKNVQFHWRCACLEFTKRINDDLPYYYYSASHDRFYEGDRSGFNEPSHTSTTRNPRHLRIRKCESLVGLAAGRTTLPVPGARSVRLTYHNVPVEIPPPIKEHASHIFEHLY